MICLYLAMCVLRELIHSFVSVKEGSANWVDRILQFHYFCRILHHEDDAVTLRVLELQFIFFLWSILGPSVPSQYNINMYTHQVHHLSDQYMLKHENYKKKSLNFYGISMKMKKQITYK